MESYGNQLTSGELVWNSVYTYTVQPKSCLCVDSGKRQKSVIVLVSTVTITNIDVAFWTYKIKYHRVNICFPLTQPTITRQLRFELTNIDYDQIKDEIASMERVDFSTDIGSNFMNEYDL